MDHRRQSVSSAVDAANQVCSESQQPEEFLPSALSDDEAFEALATSMTLFAPNPPDSGPVDQPGVNPVEPEIELVPEPYVSYVQEPGFESEAVESDPESAAPEVINHSGTVCEMEIDAPLPDTLACPVSDDLPELLPLDGGSRMAQSGQGWLDPMAFNRRPPDPPSPMPDNVSPEDLDVDDAGRGFDGRFAAMAGVHDAPPDESGADGPGSHEDESLNNSFNDIVMLGLLTGEFSSDFIAAAHTTEGAAAVSSADCSNSEQADSPDSLDWPDGQWWRPTTVAELQTVVDTYLGSVVAVSASLIQRPSLLDEVVAKTFLSAWVEGREGIPSGPMEAWLYSICVETVRRKERRMQRHGTVANTRYPAPSHRGSEEIRLAQARQIWEISLALGELDDLERRVLELSHRKELLHAEIAAETHSSLGAVKSCLYRSSGHLVNRLAHRLDEPGDPHLGSEGDEDLDGLAAEESRSDHTWYLAGVADGSCLSANDRRAIKDIRAHLADDNVWIAPTSGLREAIMTAAADNEGTLMIRSSASASALVPSGQSQPNGEQLPGPGPAGPTGVGGMARTTVRYSPDVSQVRPQSKLRRVVHPLSKRPTQRPARPLSPNAGSGAGPNANYAAVELARSSNDDLPTGQLPAVQPGESQNQHRTDVGDESGPTTVSHGKVAALAIGVIIMAAAIILAPYVLGSGSGELETLDYELQATDADPDARAVVTVSELGSETLYRLWLGGLDATGEQEFYAAWLVDPDTVGEGAVASAEARVLGSFRWTVNGEPIVLAADALEARFDHLVVTRQGPNDPPGPSGVVVLEGLVQVPGS